MKITALAGGVGGAKMAHGLASVLPPGDLTVIVNTGDDFTHYGLAISPDLDTVCYTLAGMVDEDKGWGLADDTFDTLKRLETLGGPGWFGIGDKDISTHLERTRLLRDGYLLTEITRRFSLAWGIRQIILPMTDEQVSTLIETHEKGLLTFQEYFVKYRFEPRVKKIFYQGLKTAQPTMEVVQALEHCDGVVICPSNPYLSIDPITQLAGVKEILVRKPVTCVSPIIQNKCVKGPLSKMLVEFGLTSDQEAIIRHYGDLLRIFIYDNKDKGTVTEESASGIITYTTDILLPDIENRTRLANEIIGLFEKYI
jgi:LPPG:FO 2-phospho-L-lactate transferase